MDGFDVDKAAAAVVSQHGDRAVKVAEERAMRHAIAKQDDAAALWRAVADKVRRKLAPSRS